MQCIHFEWFEQIGETFKGRILQFFVFVISLINRRPQKIHQTPNHKSLILKIVIVSIFTFRLSVHFIHHRFWKWFLIFVEFFINFFWSALKSDQNSFENEQIISAFENFCIYSVNNTEYRTKNSSFAFAKILYRHSDFSVAREPFAAIGKAFITK